MVTSVLLFWLRPFLVVMIIAPAEARDPYSTAAAGPFRTLTDSILSGFTSAKRFADCDWNRVLPVTFRSLLKMIPSTTIRGWFEPLNEVIPRILMFVDAPGA